MDDWRLSSQGPPRPWFLFSKGGVRHGLCSKVCLAP